MPSKITPLPIRLRPETSQWVNNESAKLGISKNAFIQMTLAKVQNGELKPTGTNG